MSNLILDLTNYLDRYKSKGFIKTLYKFALKTGLVKRFHEYRSKLKEVRFRIKLYNADIEMIDRSPKFYYYNLFQKQGGYEPALTKKIHDLLGSLENPFFIDIGAHFGYYTMLAGKWIKGDNPVYAFEPNPDFFETLKENISINNLTDKVKPWQIALSNKKGTANMTGWDSRTMSEDEKGSIDTFTFDQFCERERIKPDIIKIDVHGAEGKILGGMPRVLKEVSHIFCETHNSMMGFTVKDIVKMMVDGGLTVYEFTDHRNSKGGDIIPLDKKVYSDHNDRIIYGVRE
ncbi:MAG: FkbM family methyltransferase [bacterium]